MIRKFFRMQNSRFWIRIRYYRFWTLILIQLQNFKFRNLVKIWKYSRGSRSWSRSTTFGSGTGARIWNSRLWFRIRVRNIWGVFPHLDIKPVLRLSGIFLAIRYVALAC
jgi:hypothetical protein